MPVVRVDDDVWNWIKSHATPFEDTPNSVLRRLAGLDSSIKASTRSVRKRTGRKQSAGVRVNAARSGGGLRGHEETRQIQTPVVPNLSAEARSKSASRRLFNRSRV